MPTTMVESNSTNLRIVKVKERYGIVMAKNEVALLKIKLFICLSQFLPLLWCIYLNAEGQNNRLKAYEWSSSLCFEIARSFRPKRRSFITGCNPFFILC